MVRLVAIAKPSCRPRNPVAGSKQAVRRRSPLENVAALLPRRPRARLTAEFTALRLRYLRVHRAQKGLNIVRSNQTHFPQSRHENQPIGFCLAQGTPGADSGTHPRPGNLGSP